MIRQKKPVIIYFYGGSFENGHGTAELYQPAHLVQNNDIIVITCNYRLGALGYLDWSYFNKGFHSNNGLSDQINVMNWVHQFIESFGGDANNIYFNGSVCRQYEHFIYLKYLTLSHTSIKSFY